MRKTALLFLLITLITIILIFTACEPPADIKLISISIDEGSFLKNYYVGDLIEYDNAYITLLYNNNSTISIPITQDMVSDFSTNIEGTHTMQVSYEGFVATHIYKVSAKITITTVSECIAEDFKTEYIQYEKINLSGSKIIVTFSNGNSETISDSNSMIISGFDTNKVTAENVTKKLSIIVHTRYGEASCTVDYTVIPQPSLDIFIVLNATDLIFQKEDSQDKLIQILNSYQFKVAYSDGTTKELSYDTSTMSITNFSTSEVAESKLLNIQYMDAQNRKRILQLEYKVIEKIQEQQITYDYNGVGLQSNPPPVLTINGKAVMRTVTAPKGYIFEGWYSDAYYKRDIAKPWDFNTIVDGVNLPNMTLYAWWTPIEYTITYNGAGANSQNVLFNSKYDITKTFELSPNESKYGYIFEGFYEGDRKVEIIQKGTTGDIVLEAKWTPIDYNIYYEYPDDCTPLTSNPETYNIEDNIIFDEPTRTGYEFLHWENKTTHQIVEAITVNSTGNITLVSKWQIIEYTINYNLAKNKGESAEGARETYTIEDETFTLSPAKKSGYTFAGWFTDVNFTQEQYKEGNYYKVLKGNYGNIELYPLFLLNYEIVFSVGGGDKLNSKIFTENEEIVTLPKATRHGYTFVNWKVYDDSTIPYGDVSAAELKSYIAEGYISLVLEAQWEKTEYTIIYMSADGNKEIGRDTYTIYTDKPLLDLDIANFIGWAETKHEQDAENIWTQLPQGVWGNKILYAIIDLE